VTEYASIPVGLHPPVALALAKAVERIPEAGALPGPLLYEPKWDGFLHCTLSIIGHRPDAGQLAAAALISSG
jgi:hypothetical protein